MKSNPRCTGRSCTWAIAGLSICLSSVFALGADEPQSAPAEQGKFAVHDVSLWVLEPGSKVANARTAFPSALPGVANSARSIAASPPLNPDGNNFPQAVVATSAPTHSPAAARTAPINLLTFHGEATANLDIDIRTRAGGFLAHWPAGESLPNRLRWAGTPSYDLVAKIADESELPFVDADHWIRKAREADALYIKRGDRAERFLAYDAELTNLGSPIQLKGGPETYTVINTSGATLYDVLISRHTPQGRRIAWIDVLPPATPVNPPADAPAKSEAGKPEASKDKVPAGVFDNEKNAAPAAPAAEKPAEEPAQKPTEKPAEKPATTNATVEAKPAAKQADIPKFLTRLGLKVPPAVQAAQNKPNQKPGEAAATPKAEVELKGVEVTLSEPLPAGQDATLAATRETLRKRLAATGLTADEVELFVSRYESLFFEGQAVVVACRLDAGKIDELLPLSIFPLPSKVVRVPIVIMRNADPQLDSEIEKLIAQLGDAKYSVREEAQARLKQLGSLAFPLLQKGTSNSDLEIVIRCERILLSQGQTPGSGTAAKAPGAAGAVVNGVLIAPAVAR